MLEADPTQRRQLSLSAPDILWRDGGAQREGLVVGAFACSNPECPCRELELDVYRVNERLAGVQVVDEKVVLEARPGPPGDDPLLEKGALVLRAELDIDTGLISIPEAMPSDVRDEGALAWLREEMDGAFLDHLADKILLGKGLRPLSRVKVADFEPGVMVPFAEAFLTGRVDAYVLDGRHFEVFDQYCVEPGCRCADMRLSVYKDRRDAGSLIVDLGTPGWSFRRDGKPEIDKVAKAVTDRYPSPEPFRARARRMKGAGPDIMANARPQPFVAAPGIGRNQPCPCGSGKKYKRCCLRENTG